MSVQVLYKTSSTANGGRDGRSKSDDSDLDIVMSTPKELGGAGKAGNNPEQLFATGYAACFLGALKYAASQGGGVKVPEGTTVTATVGIGPRGDGGFGLDVQLDISLPGVAHDDAVSLAEKADKVCPYSHATRGNIDVRLNVIE